MPTARVVRPNVCISAKQDPTSSCCTTGLTRAMHAKQLLLAVNMITGVKGRASISASVVQIIFMLLATTELPGMTKEQQMRIRAKHGENIAIDSTYQSAASIGAGQIATH